MDIDFDDGDSQQNIPSNDPELKLVTVVDYTKRVVQSFAYEERESYSPKFEVSKDRTMLVVGNSMGKILVYKLCRKKEWVKYTHTTDHDDKIKKVGKKYPSKTKPSQIYSFKGE